MLVIVVVPGLIVSEVAPIELLLRVFLQVAAGNLFIALVAISINNIHVDVHNNLWYLGRKLCPKSLLRLEAIVLDLMHGHGVGVTAISKIIFHCYKLSIPARFDIFSEQASSLHRVIDLLVQSLWLWCCRWYRCSSALYRLLCCLNCGLCGCGCTCR